MNVAIGNFDTQNAEALAALERFVVDNDDLLALESLVGRFNIFDALDIARVEIRHSNFLSFILDPAESHGQGQLFLKAVLMDLLKAAPAEKRPLSPIDLDGTDLSGVEVRREWANIDLLVTCEQPPFVIAIENKIGSQEHSDQLGRYERTIRTHYPDARPLFVYLTPNADEPSEDTWVTYSYSDIHRVLARVRKAYHSAIGEDVLIFLDHYLSLIGARFMNDTSIDQLCQRIYKNHRHALDLIFERIGSSKSGVLIEAEAVLQEDPRWHVFYRAANVIDFIPKAWLEWLPPVGLDDQKDNPHSWLIFRLELMGGKLNYYVEVRRMADLAKRRQIIDKLIAEGPKFGFRHSGREVTDNYTRVSSREGILKWDEDHEPETDSIRIAVKKKLDEVFPRIQGVPLVLKPLFNPAVSGA
jgi:hypothetical protein